MLCTDLVIADLPATSKKQAFQAIAERLEEGMAEIEAEAVLAALLEREKIGTTGIGGGVAIPHIKMPGITGMIGVLAKLESAVDYDAVDGDPVDILYLLIAPQEARDNQHLRMLARISRFLRDPITVARLRSSASRDEMLDVVADWQKSQAA